MVLDIPFVLPTKPDTFDITLFVSAPATRQDARADPLDDLVIENVARPECRRSADRHILLRDVRSHRAIGRRVSRVEVKARPWRVWPFSTNPVPFPL